MHLTKSVAAYLGLDPAAPIPLKIDEVTLLLFGTHAGVLVVELRLLTNAGKGPLLPTLIEAMHLLGDERQSRRPMLTWTAAKSERFRLSDLLRPLVKSAGVSVETGRRIFSYVSAVVDGTIDPAVKREIAFRLSRRYNYIYDPDIQGKEALFLTPFNNVT